MGLFKKDSDATPLQRAVRELEEINQQLEDGDTEADERDELLARRQALEERIAELRDEPQGDPRSGMAEDQLSSFR